MKPIFHPHLVNKTSGDPALYIDFLFDQKAILFDLGDISSLPAKKLLRITDIFISHTHMDHFFGFDHLLRISLGREKRICIYGPPGILENIAGKLQGYTWNLVSNYNNNLIFEVTEIHDDYLKRNIFSCKERFHSTRPVEIISKGEFLLDTLSFKIKCTCLDHSIPCLAFCLEEKNHLNVNKVKLEEMKLPIGPWLKELKDAIRSEKPEDTLLSIPMEDKEGKTEKKEPLSFLKSVINVSRGQKIVYAVDFVYNISNNEKVLALAKEADYFFCESSFLEKDHDRAAHRYHLTAYQAGLLARKAKVKKLIPFHFSPRYHGFYHLIVEEANRSFKEFC